MDNKRPFQAREGHWQTPANKVCRVPPSAVPSMCYEPLYTSSNATSSLRCFHRSLCTATVQQPYSNTATALHPIDQRKRVLIAMQHCNPSGSVPWSHTYVRCMEATQDHPFSLDCSREEERWLTPDANESWVLSWIYRTFSSNPTITQVSLLQRYISSMRLILLAPIAIEMSRKPSRLPSPAVFRRTEAPEIIPV